MSPIRVTMRRTIGMIGKQYVTAFASTVFFAGAAALFVFNLDAGEGGFASLAALWAISLSPILPAFAALLGMEVWSDELKTGRIDLLLTSPVKERDFVLGKFLGIWAMTLMAIGVFLTTSLFIVNSHAPKLMEWASWGGFILGIFILALQSALWSAVAVAFSALFRNAAGAAATTLFVLVAVPRALWLALSHWTNNGSARFGELPMDVHAFDFASGLVSVATVVGYGIFTTLALYIATKTVASYRLVGRGKSKARLMVRICVVLGFFTAILASTLVNRVDITLDMPVVGSGETQFSPRTRNILSNSHGTVVITAFMDRKDSRFRHVGHFLRSFKRAADELGGVNIEIKYVDPVLDIDESLRFTRAELLSPSLVFERDERIVGTINIDEGYGEWVCASFIERATGSINPSTIYWTVGHGEARFDNYGIDGLSDIARDITLVGYENKPINLAEVTRVNSDCKLLVIAGPKTDFSSKELSCLKEYFYSNSGGRVLILADTIEARNLLTLFSEWGVRPTVAKMGEVPTISGSDVVVREFSSHPIVGPFEGQQVILERPIALEPSLTATENSGAADRKRFTKLLNSGNSCFAAIVEHGEASSDLAIRPTRVMAIGDVGFVMNGKLRAYANANRDFILNSVKYLTGRDSLTQVGLESGRLVSGLDRASRVDFAIAISAIFPVVFFVIYALYIKLRRRSK